LLGIILMSASVVFRRFSAVRENGLSESTLPSTSLFADFSFIAGSFIGIADISYSFPSLFFGGYLGTSAKLFLLFISPILVGTSLYLWQRKRHFQSNVRDHRLAWEIFSTVWISTLLIVLFLPMGGIFSFQVNIGYPPLTIGLTSIAMIFFGSYSIFNAERKVVSTGPMQTSRGNIPMRSSFKKLFMTIFLVTLVAASSLTVLTNDFGYAYTNCGGAFGLYSCNVRTITVSSITLYGGTTASGTLLATSNMSVELNNPEAPTTITELSLAPSTAYSFSSPSTDYSQILHWSATSNSKDNINFSARYFVGGANSINASSVNRYVFYPVSTENGPIVEEEIIPSQTYSYQINFANGQSISGSLIAQ
ncbi:MAG: hypothetical protein JRN15_11965, partial [Nitrososphaerota archaeon]|nr:hypothetical protein [Nitrososphaerota archaeon]